MSCMLEVARTRKDHHPSNLTAAEPRREHRVFLMQPHPLMILGTTSFLSRQSGMLVDGSTSNPEAALEAVVRANPDVAVLELSINGPFDFPFLHRLRQTLRTVPILAYSYHEEVIFARRALDAGANGYLMKDAPPDRLPHAIRIIAAGETYLSERVRDRIYREEQLAKIGGGETLNGALVNSLTIHELQVFQCLGDGNAPSRIQKELNLTPSAFKRTCYRIRKKLGVETQSALRQIAFHWAYYEGDFS